MWGLENAKRDHWLTIGISYAVIIIVLLFPIGVLLSGMYLSYILILGMAYGKAIIFIRLIQTPKINLFVSQCKLVLYAERRFVFLDWDMVGY